MPKLLFHPDIASEVKASYLWYQEQANGLGDDFLDELANPFANEILTNGFELN